MQEIVTERVIPERRYKEIKYVSEDGYEYPDKAMCEYHEERMKIEKHPVFATKIRCVELPFSDDNVTLYHLRSKEDYDYFRKYNCINITLDDYDRYGPGWYAFEVFDGGDSPDWAHLFNFTQYCREMRFRLSEWITDTENKIADKLKEGCV